MDITACCDGDQPCISFLLRSDQNGLALTLAASCAASFCHVVGSALAAGYDLSASADCVVPGRGRALVKTDISMACPEGTYGRIAPRSGLAWKKFIDVGAGVVDADYRGDVGVILFNFGDEDFVVNPGDRVAQLILEKVLFEIGRASCRERV